MKQTNSKKGQQIEWRRTKVFELSVKGFSQADIARMLNIPKVTISRDVADLREQSRKNIEQHIGEKLPYEYSKCIEGLEQIIKEGWLIAINADKNGDTREKLSSLALIKDTYNTKMDLLTNASLLQQSIKFVEQSKENTAELTSAIKSNNKKENLENGVQRSTEDITDKQQESTINYNQVY